MADDKILMHCHASRDSPAILVKMYLQNNPTGVEADNLKTLIAQSEREMELSVEI